MKRFMQSIRAPWTLAVVALATAASMYLLLHSGLGLEKTAFIVAATMVGGLGTQALKAVAIGAMKTVIVMTACMLILLLTAVTATDAAVFKDMAIEGVAAGAAGSIIVIIGALLDRHQE